MTYTWNWGPRMRPIGELKCLDRKGQKCRVIARGRMNSAMIEFEDGFRAVVSRNGIRRLSLAGKDQAAD